MSWHFEPVVFVARHYALGTSYEEHSPYDAVAVIQVQGDLALVSALHGEIDRTALRALRDALRARGVTRLATLRHGKRVEWDLEAVKDK